LNIKRIHQSRGTLVKVKEHDIVNYDWFSGLS
jgi:hypothetical protein